MYDPQIGRWMEEDPSEFEAGDADLYRFVGNDPMNATDPSGLYETDVHFYMTYYVGKSIGLDDYEATIGGKKVDLAYLIAWADEYTDWNTYTTPLPAIPYASRSGQRWAYHFAATRSEGKVVAGSRLARQQLDRGIDGKGDNPWLIGIGLHTYQDSWSHEGFGSFWGHMNADYGGHGPDYPWTDVPKAMKMAEATYDMLAKLMTAMGGTPKKKWSDLSGKIHKLFGSSPDTPLPKDLGNKDPVYPREKQRRIDEWVAFITGEFGSAPPSEPGHTDDEPWTPYFRSVADDIWKRLMEQDYKDTERTLPYGGPSVK